MTLNDEFAAAREAGEKHVTALERDYGAAIRKAGRQAADRFSARATTLHAAANWQPPDVGDVMAFAVNADRIRGTQRQMLGAIGGRVTDIPGVSFDALAAPSEAHLGALGLRAAAMSQDLRTPVAAAIAEGWAKGYSVPQTAGLIRQAVNGLASGRATMLARTDLISLSNGTNHNVVGILNEAAKEAGEPLPVQSKTWLSAQDGRVRETHAEADGQTVPIDQPYNVGGFDLDYPGDPSGPDEEVINCRCTELYSDEAATSATSPETPAEASTPEFGVKMEGDWSTNPAALQAVEGQAGRLVREFDTEFNRVLLRDAEEFGQLAGKSRDTVYLSPRFLDDAFMDDWLATFARPYTVQAERTDVVTHEFGHIVDGEMLRRFPEVYRRWTEHLDEEVQVVGVGAKPGATAPRRSQGLLAPSPYGAENVYEWFAEAFTDWYLHRSSVTNPSSKLVGELMEVFLRSGVTASVLDRPGLPFQERTEEAGMSTIEQAVEVRWISDVAFEGVSTGDGRYMAPGSLGWRDLPLTLMSMIETPEMGGHSGAQVAGRMDTFDKDSEHYMDGTPLDEGVTAVRSTGVFDVQGDRGGETARLVETETMRGISMDLAVYEWALRDPETGEMIDPETASDSDWERAFMGELEFAVIEGEIMAATVCPTPAFAEARIAILAAAKVRPNVWRANSYAAFLLGVDEGQMMTTLVASVSPVLSTLEAPFQWESANTGSNVTASVRHARPRQDAAPLAPPAAWLHRPEPKEPTPWTMLDSGECFGHLALWETCHTGYLNGEFAQCVRAPHSITSYGQYHVGELRCDGGELLPIGKVTYDTGHADLSRTRAAARCHYDDTGAVGAFVRARDGQFGIWVSGALRSDLSPEGARDLRANPLSGDWRDFERNLELIAALAVPVPGFPVARSQLALSASADGDVRITALILTGLGLTAGATTARAGSRNDEHEGAALDAIIAGGAAGLAELIG